jgi:hypothetical protein
MPGRWPRPIYTVTVEIRAPPQFVFKWCTDYSRSDGSISREWYKRRILKRNQQTIVLEDLYDTKKGWTWIRRTVRLIPPLGWHADSVGSDRALSVDYSLSEIPGNFTQLRIRARRRPYGIGTENPPKLRWERAVRRNWSKFTKRLEEDYLRSQARKSPTR